MQKYKLNWDIKKSIELKEKLPELAEYLYKLGREKINAEILKDVLEPESQEYKALVESKNKELETLQTLLTNEKRRKNKLYLLQMEVMKQIAEKRKQQATELIVDYIKENYHIYTTKEDIKPEMWIYVEGIYVPNGKSFLKELCRIILSSAFTMYLCNEVVAKIEADTFIDHDKFFGLNYLQEIPVQNGILNIRTRKLNPPLKV